jgi:prevent-host-death family protein
MNSLFIMTVTIYRDRAFRNLVVNFSRRWVQVCGCSTAATVVTMEQLGLRELRQSASEYVRRVEAGESFTVTVSGRPAARLVPAGGRRWRRYEEISEVLGGPGAPDLAADRDALTQSIKDPFEA